MPAATTAIPAPASAAPPPCPVIPRLRLAHRLGPALELLVVRCRDGRLGPVTHLHEGELTAPPVWWSVMMDALVTVTSCPNRFPRLALAADRDRFPPYNFMLAA